MRSLLLALFAVLGFTACGGAGCSRLEPIPGGFPSAKRAPNAAQLRVSATGFDAIEANPKLFFQQLFGPSLQLNGTPSCGGSTTVCCPGGMPSTSCGPIALDPTLPPAGDARLVVTPVQGASRVDVTMRMRVWTLSDLPVTLPTVGDCGLRVETAPGATSDVQLDVPFSFAQDATAGTTRVVLGTLSISRLTTDDVALVGGFGCTAANFGLSFYLGILTDQLSAALQEHLQSSFCKSCPGGDVSGCGPFATACTDGVCMQGAQCLQELGPTGRLTAAALFDGAPPGGAGALDVYGVAGGYATTNNSGAALGILGGELPAGPPSARCGPPATPPSAVTVPPSGIFQGNTRPDTGAAFDFALGLHRSQLEQFAYAAYEGGALCPTFESRSLPALSSDALLPVAPSLGGLTGGEGPLWVGFRPQSPPTVSVGANTFDAGVVTAPLLSLAFPQAELDLFAQVERQPLRVATVVGDLTVPLGAKAGAPGAVPLVLGALPAPANVSVKNHEPLQETPEALAALAPLLQEAVIPEMVRRVGPLPLPTVAGMQVTPQAITPVDGDAFVAVFGALAAPDGGMGTTLPTITPRPGTPRPVSPPDASPRSAPFFLLLFALVGLGLLVSARRRWLPAWGTSMVALALLAALASVSCSDSPDVEEGKTPEQPDRDAGTDGSVSCEPAPCASGELEPRLGAWSSVAAGARTVIATYDERYGDAVLVELLGGEQRRRVIDGVPDVPPTHAPSGYRSGVEAAGPDVGAWPSLALAGDRVRVVYQDRQRGALRFAAEDAQGGFRAHDVDVPSGAGVEAGAYASLALSADSTPAVAYVVAGLPGADGARMTELRFARAKTQAPSESADWTTTVIASAPGSCAGLCGTEVCLAPESAGGDERCVTPTSDCAEACGSGQACVAGTCRARVPATSARLPTGTGLHARLLGLADGRFLVLHYDSRRSALVAALETASGSGQFGETVLDGDGTLDRGQWVAAVVDAAGMVHAAYVDGVSRQVYAVRFTPGSTPGAPELVDDGVRPGDRPHWVGAGLTAWLDGATFRVAYQDAMSADVVVATRAQGGWTHADLVTGSTLDGFALAAPASGNGPLVWNRLAPKDPASRGLTILPTP